MISRSRFSVLAGWVAAFLASATVRIGRRQNFDSARSTRNSENSDMIEISIHSLIRRAS